MPSSFWFSVRNAGAGTSGTRVSLAATDFSIGWRAAEIVVFPSMELRLLHGSAASCEQAPLGLLLFARRMRRKALYGK
ncbi:exported hypothetical protein [Mesorhizobium sp. ORS 3324]|nr:exported hypothetical protein [Mesorhizobium sp. ORS 3324]